jgi:perosamine synthetase
MDPERRYYFPVTGYNFRLTNLACAILCAQIERSEGILTRRREIFSVYRRLLDGTPGIGFQPVAPWAEPAPWLFCITVDGKEYGKSRDALMAHMDANGVETRPFFLPLHKLPPFRGESRRRGENLPVTDRLGAEGVSLPTFHGMEDSDIERIVAIVRRFRTG